MTLLGETKEKMLHELRSGKKTAKDLALILNIQVSAARKHLETMSRLMIVKEEFVQEGIGRPKKFYLLTEDGKELFPRQYETVLSCLLDEIGKMDGHLGESIVKELAREIVKRFGNNYDKGDHPTAKEELANALTDFGFDVGLEETKTSFIITSHNCPLYKVARKHQKLACHGVHGEIIKSTFGVRDVRLEACMAWGDNCCSHIIEKKNM